MKIEDFKETHPNFTIICDKCGSKNVYVENSLGYSSTSGSWGSVDLMCNDCDNYTEIVSA
jgi:ribosomal protein S27E